MATCLTNFYTFKCSGDGSVLVPKESVSGGKYVALANPCPECGGTDYVFEEHTTPSAGNKKAIQIIINQNPGPRPDLPGGNVTDLSPVENPFGVE